MVATGRSAADHAGRRGTEAAALGPPSSLTRRPFECEARGQSPAGTPSGGVRRGSECQRRPGGNTGQGPAMIMARAYQCLSWWTSVAGGDTQAALACRPPAPPAGGRPGQCPARGRQVQVRFPCIMQQPSPAHPLVNPSTGRQYCVPTHPSTPLPKSTHPAPLHSTPLAPLS